MTAQIKTRTKKKPSLQSKVNSKKRPGRKKKEVLKYTTFEEIYSMLQKIFKDSRDKTEEESIIVRYKFYLAELRGSERVRIMMQGREVIEIYGNSFIFKERKAYTAIKQDEVLGAMLEELEKSNRLYGI